MRLGLVACREKQWQQSVFSAAAAFHGLNRVYILLRRSVGGIELQRDLKLLQRIVQLPLFRKGHSKIHMRPRKIRTVANNFRKLYPCIFNFFLSREFDSQQVTRLPEGRVHPDRRLKKMGHYSDRLRGEGVVSTDNPAQPNSASPGLLGASPYPFG